MVVIRLTRRGGKKRPFYHVTVADQRRAPSGHQLERLGFFNPLARGGDERLRVDLERLDMWRGRGAQMSARVRDLVCEARLDDEGLARRQQLLDGRRERREERRRRAVATDDGVAATELEAVAEDAPDSNAESVAAAAEVVEELASTAAEADSVEAADEAPVAKDDEAPVAKDDEAPVQRTTKLRLQRTTKLRLKRRSTEGSDGEAADAASDDTADKAAD